jgi:hypothetical protein
VPYTRLHLPALTLNQADRVIRRRAAPNGLRSEPPTWLRDGERGIMNGRSKVLKTVKRRQKYVIVHKQHNIV